MIAMVTAQYGMMAAQRRFDDSASRVARMDVPGENVDLVQEVVSMAMAKTDFAANAQVIKAADRMTRDVLDILA